MNLSNEQELPSLHAPEELTIERSTRLARIRGLDSIRFVCAVWVVFGHLGFLPVFQSIGRDSPLELAMRGLTGNLFAGPPAVIVFFVISGFCIHYPFKIKQNSPTWRFLLKRYLRIGAPACAATLFIQYFTPENPAFNVSALSGTVVWSLIAEVIYYTLYPGLLKASRTFGWGKIFGFASCLALAVILLNPTSRYLPSVGPWLTWLVGLPYWILGCILAENNNAIRDTPVSVREIWKWRIGIWIGSSVASGVMFHGGIGYPWTMIPFGMAVYLWMAREIAYFTVHRPWQMLEWAGLWSYSIYAWHMILPDILLPHLSTHLSPNIRWCALILGVMTGCYLLYLLVEKPSHWLERRIRVR